MIDDLWWGNKIFSLKSSIDNPQSLDGRVSED